eukprot:6784566-Prymnesium_polylepis.2
MAGCPSARRTRARRETTCRPPCRSPRPTAARAHSSSACRSASSAAPLSAYSARSPASAARTGGGASPGRRWMA